MNEPLSNDPVLLSYNKHYGSCPPTSKPHFQSKKLEAITPVAATLSDVDIKLHIHYEKSPIYQQW